MAEIPGGDPVARGLELARLRCDAHGIALSDEHWQLSENQVREYLEAAQPEISERAAELLAEHLAISTASRAYYEEPPLSADVVSAYVSQAQEFFNSFWHDRPAYQLGWTQ
jgi:hypothetical protein